MAGVNSLGDALRAWRNRLDPATVGIPQNVPRRVPGLRRGELAALAGISVEYVVRLEQGRAPTPSAQVCLALARALQLTGDEADHLLRLAGHAAGPGRIPRLIPPSLHRIMQRLTEHPVAVFDAVWDLLHWNPLWSATFGDPTSRTDRNVLFWQFDGKPGRARQSPADRAAFEESLVADLHAATGRYPSDPSIAAVLARLQRSARFRELWARPSVAQHESSHKVVDHPDVGEIPLDCDVLTTQGSNFHVVVYTPSPDTDARGKLDLLAAIGTQQMTPA
ncbi:DNA-binding protein [Actinoplanes awajinensis subsp. mycoplanecinus]|uniref:DNA-binding protein n=1 Tax=Actinoplanes awajinensis subsp. mycoplanecinus TaxID=135947 RepID=A0A101JEL1_9ACTN|nr:helix-turn-helix transcriptional regulator [Actinoplanes awajinensis]KUL25396.1 DNA-binding protein [Actinoplanes awajinensis subsp. mycoplanecinus]